MTRSIVSAASLAALFSLTACGGGGGDTAAVVPVVVPQDVGVQVNGTVTGFGSVIIDGVHYDDTGTSVKIENDPSALGAGTLSDVKLGMQVEAVSSGGKLSNVTIHGAMMGAVGAVDVAAGKFTVYKQTVSVVTTGATPTVFDGASGLSSLVVGDVVEVHGTLDGNKQVVATRVERKAATDIAVGVRLVGIVSALDATAKTFKLNDLIVNYSAAAVLPSTQALANGQLVSVYSKGAPSAGAALLANGIKIASAGEGANFDIGGRIMVFNSVSDFTVGGIRIDASAAIFESGAAPDLVLGANVAVEGKVVAGVLKATKARVIKTSVDVKASLTGAITDFVTNTSFKVRGTPVDASAAKFAGGTASDFGNGANVKIVGHVVGDLLKADLVEFSTLAAVGVTKLKGEIRDFDAKTGSFHFLGVNLKLSTTVQFVDGSTADLGNGKRVEITGTALPSASTAGASALPTIEVSKLEFLGELAPHVSVVVGRVDGFSAAGFKLPGVAVVFADTTSFTGGVLADLGNGMEVLVTGVWSPQKQALVATSIELRKPVVQPTPGAPVAGSVGVVGAITDFTSKGAFRIGQQKVDASDAVFFDGTEADLANGRAVEAAGTIAGVEGARYVKLSKLRFRK